MGRTRVYNDRTRIYNEATCVYNDPVARPLPSLSAAPPPAFITHKNAHKHEHRQAHTHTHTHTPNRMQAVRQMTMFAGARAAS